MFHTKPQTDRSDPDSFLLPPLTFCARHRTLGLALTLGKWSSIHCILYSPTCCLPSAPFQVQELGNWAHYYYPSTGIMDYNLIPLDLKSFFHGGGDSPGTNSPRHSRRHIEHSLLAGKARELFLCHPNTKLQRNEAFGWERALSSYQGKNFCSHPFQD